MHKCDTRLHVFNRVLRKFAYRTGCRRGEILNLKWRSVDLGKHPNVKLEPGETKSGDDRVIPLTSDLVRTFEALHENQ
jgi:integrase